MFSTLVVSDQETGLHYTPDINFYQEPDDDPGDGDHSSRSQTPETPGFHTTGSTQNTARLSIHTTKVGTHVHVHTGS